MDRRATSSRSSSSWPAARGVFLAIGAALPGAVERRRTAGVARATG